MGTAFTIDEHGRRQCIELPRALAAAARGEVVVLPGALHDLGFLSTFRGHYLAEIERQSSSAVAQAVKEHGLERLHEHLDPPQVAVLLEHLDRRVSALAVPLARAVVAATVSDPRVPYFICPRVWVRAQVPYRLLETYPDLLAAKHLYGHLLPIGPHRDVWLTHPRDTLSIWAALAPVRAGNTIAFLADDESIDGREGSAAGTAVRACQLPPSTIAPALDPGDVLVFNADRLHCSIRNETEETRVVIGTRVVMGRRLRYGSGPHWRPYYDARLVGTRLERFATFQSRLTPATVRRWRARRRWERERQRSTRHERGAKGSSGA